MLLFSKQKFKSCPCPICTYNVSEVLYEYRTADGSWPFYLCSSCGFAFIRPMPIDSLHERSMESIEDAELFSPLFRKMHEKLILNREEHSLLSISGDHKLKLLDIGCGSGWTTEYWCFKGFDVEAVEPSKARCDFARSKYRFNIHNCFVEDLKLENSYDVVVMRHILEHLEDPVRILNSVNYLLKKDGLVLIVVPNCDSIGVKLFGRHWEWVLPWHCNFFTPASLIKLLTSCGFGVETEYKSPSPLYYGESLGRLIRSTSIEEFFNRNRIANLIFSLPISLVGLFTGKGDNLTIIARKQVSS